MKLSQTQVMHRYWHQQCRGRSMPDRHDLDPIEMRGMLPYTFILNVALAPQGTSYTIRLSGTRLDALVDGSLKGRNFLDLWAEQDRGLVEALLRDVLDGSQPIVAGLNGAPSGYAASRFELLLLPLRHHGRTHERVLCSLVPSTTPQWSGLKPIEAMLLTSWRFVEPSEATTPNLTSPAVRRSQLRLIDGGRSAAQTPVGSKCHVKAGMTQIRDTPLVNRHL